MAIASTVCKRHVEDGRGWEHPWVCITDGNDMDQPALWVWVNEILLDSSNEALVLDCCVMLVDRFGGEASTQLGAAIELDEIHGGAGIFFAKVRFAPSMNM